MGAKSSKVLLVEDSADDRALFASAWKRAASSLQLLEPMEDGASAIDYLQGSGQYSDRGKFPYPDLMLLDLKMPLKNGWEVLEWLQKQTARPVTVVFSGSDRTEDIQKALSLGADYYQVKPPEFEGWISTVRVLERYMAGRD